MVDDKSQRSADDRGASDNKVIHRTADYNDNTTCQAIEIARLL